MTDKALIARFQRRAAAMRPDLARRYLAALDMIVGALSEAELADAIASGMAEALIEAIMDDRLMDEAFAPLRAYIDRAALDAGAAWTSTLPGSASEAVFGVLSPRIIEAVRQLDTRVIQGMRRDIRETVRGVVREGIEAGKGPRVIAVRIRESVGLSPSHARAVAKFRRELESGDRAALGRMLARGQLRRPDGSVLPNAYHAGGQGLSDRDMAMLARRLGRDDLRPDQIERMVRAYRRRLVALNAETHARSIALDTERLGQRLAWESAIERGTFDAGRVVREWRSVRDSRVRPEHQELDGVRARWGEPYPNGESVPGEFTYNCRCVERIILLREERIAA